MAPEFYHRDKRRQYLLCKECSLVFVPPGYHLAAEKEKAEYDLHRNSPDDGGYRNFLNRLFMPLHERIRPGSQGLDFGCGPGPALSMMFEEAGFSMAVYDHFYANDRQSLAKKYDFITATEVVEHLHNPAGDLNMLWALLKPGGYLGIMTKQVINKKAFSRWHYIQDPTHICFFSLATFQWLADLWQGELQVIGNDVILFQKQDKKNVKGEMEKAEGVYSEK
jgi:2-polyprenyl-3-methyl-5-hydroxy-6-metoxy-1,4-benzoquinol methylase